MVSFPVGEYSRHVTISSEKSSRFSDLDFARYEFLSQYDAIWDKRTGVVEAMVGYAPADGMNYVLSRQADPAALVVTDRDGAQIRFGDPSAAARALLDTDDGRFDATLTMTGARVVDCEDATIQLGNIGAAFLFQLSLAKGYLCSLAEFPAADKDPVPRRGDADYRWDMELTFTERSIPPEPLKLYYYAGTLSNEYPSLRFLAYYQVLEYFFVRYSYLDLVQSVSSMLCGADFDAADARQVEQVVNHVLDVSAGRRRNRHGFGSEDDQLRATVAACVRPDLLRRFLTSHERDGVPLGRHLADQQRITGVSAVDIERIGDNRLLAALAKRLYGLRNRIVHAKQGSEENGSQPLFPFSTESAALTADIEVLRYVAAWVLIESAESAAVRGTGPS